MTPFSPSVASKLIIESTPRACEAINTFSQEILRTRGGRIGSGMGTLLEAMWGYYTNRELDLKIHEARQLELVWLIGNEFNDFACVERDGEWIPLE